MTTLVTWISMVAAWRRGRGSSSALTTGTRAEKRVWVSSAEAEAEAEDEGEAVSVEEEEVEVESSSSSPPSQEEAWFPSFCSSSMLDQVREAGTGRRRRSHFWWQILSGNSGLVAGAHLRIGIC